MYFSEILIADNKKCLQLKRVLRLYKSIQFDVGIYMVVRKREGSLSKDEKRIVKSLLNLGWRNQDIQALVNTGREATINSARITEVKSNPAVKPASDKEVTFYIKKKQSYDFKTGLNLYDDERIIRSREAMILAVNVFNNSSLLFKTEVFSVLSNIAWTYLLHEYYEQKKKISITGKDGRTLLLSQMIERTDAPLTKGMKNNLRDIIEIRNNVEHKVLSRTDKKFFPKFQACCLNFDKVLCGIFGEKLSLQNELSLALQFAKLSFEQIQTIQDYDIPEHISALDARLNDRLSDEEKDDLEYQFRVIYTLESSTKSGAHIQFIKPDSAEGREIHNVLEKHKISDDLYPYKPQEVWQSVSERTGKKFTSNNHTQAMYLYGARPKTKSQTPENTNKKFCVYHKAHKDYTYSQGWIDHLVQAVSNDTEYERIKSYRLA